MLKVQLQIQELLASCKHFNITLNDGSILKDICIFTKENTPESIIYDLEEYNRYMLLHQIKKREDGERYILLYFSGKYIQGHFIPQQVKEIVECHKDNK